MERDVLALVRCQLLRADVTYVTDDHRPLPFVPIRQATRRPHDTDASGLFATQSAIASNDANPIVEA